MYRSYGLTLLVLIISIGIIIPSSSVGAAKSSPDAGNQLTASCYWGAGSGRKNVSRYSSGPISGSDTTSCRDLNIHSSACELRVTWRIDGGPWQSRTIQPGVWTVLSSNIPSGATWEMGIVVDECSSSYTTVYWAS